MIGIFISAYSLTVVSMSIVVGYHVSPELQPDWSVRKESTGHYSVLHPEALCTGKDVDVAL